VSPKPDCAFSGDMGTRTSDTRPQRSSFALSYKRVTFVTDSQRIAVAFGEQAPKVQVPEKPLHTGVFVLRYTEFENRLVAENIRERANVTKAGS